MLLRPFFGGTILALIFSSSVLAAEDLPPSSLIFNHSLHLQSGMVCDDCHKVARDLEHRHNPNLSGYEPYPSMLVCAGCHDQEVGDEAKCGMCHVIENSTIFNMKTRDSLFASEDPQHWKTIATNFAHGLNAHSKMRCDECHTKIALSTTARDNNFPTREGCGHCHKTTDQGNPKDCVQCHKHGPLRNP